MVSSSPNFRKNQPLSALSKADLALLQPNLEPVELEVHKVLEAPNKPIGAPSPFAAAPRAH
jgi:hypothetical protein